MKWLNMVKEMKKENKRAFTLIELMGVLVIIGVLSVILVPVISKTLKESKEKLYQKQLTSIKLAAQNLGSDNTFILPTDQGETIYVTLEQLKKSGYIDKSIINPKTKEEFSDCTIVEIMRKSDYYEYNVLEDTLNSTNCQSDSKVTISEPSKRYIKEGALTSYIIIVKSLTEDNNMFVKYNIDNSKILLTNNGLEYNGDAKYLVVGENGIYKLTIKGGNDEGQVGLTLKPNSITDESGNNLVESDRNTTEISVDNTAPTITFGTNGSDWSKSVLSKINVTDSSSGANASTYKYVYSTDKNVDPSNTFDTANPVSLDSQTGNYYLIAYACDNADNCTRNVSNVFKLDNIAPSCGTWSGQNSNWTKDDVKITMTGTDSDSGMDPNRTAYINTYNSGTHKVENLSYTIADKVGNTRECTVAANIYVDKEGPTTPTIALKYEDNSAYNQTWTKRNVKQIQSSSDSGSGVAKYLYTVNGGSSWPDMPKNWLINWDGNWTFQVKACDGVGNCSSPSSSYWIGRDTVAPWVSCWWDAAAPDTINTFSLRCKYSDASGIVKIKYANCYNISGNSSSYTCGYKSYNDRYNNPGTYKSANWANANLIWHYNDALYIGFNIALSSGSSMDIKFNFTDEAGNDAGPWEWRYSK